MFISGVKNPLAIILALLLLSTTSGSTNTNNTDTTDDTSSSIVEVEDNEEPANIETIQRYKSMINTENSKIGKVLDYHYIEKKDNVLYSPFSFDTAMGMLMSGAEGKTLEELNAYYGISDVNEKIALDRELVKYYRVLNVKDDKPEKPADEPVGEPGMVFEGPVGKGGYDRLKLYTANGLFINNDLPVKTTYTNSLKSNYKAELYSLDFKNESKQSAETINKWVSENTQDKIKDIVNEESVKPSDAILVNTLYFKCPWQDEYSDNCVRDTEFANVKGNPVTVKGMYDYEEHQDYYEISTAKAFGKDYQGYYEATDDGSGLSYNFSFIGILPDESIIDENGDFNTSDIDIEKLIASKSNAYIVDSMMPKFKVEDSVSLVDFMKSNNVTSVFSPNTSELFKICDPVNGEVLYVTGILQKVVVDVNKDGTEAAAATAISMELGAAAPGEEEPEVKEVILDRPFMFLIYDNNTGTVLFSGKIVNLPEKE